YNSRYVEMYGLSPHVVKPGCTIEDLLCHHKEVGTLSEDVEQYCATLDAAIAEGKTTSTMESSANGRTIHTVSRPMADGGWVTTHEDVTDRISAQRERDRKLSGERLRQAQKMETIGNLTGGLAHDFNNLLTVIIGNLDSLQELTKDKPDQKRLVELVLEASLRGAELTRQLLAFSRRQPLQPKITDLDDLIGKTARLLTQVLGENIRLNVQLEPNVGSILVDEAQMESALINMAVNARDAMPDGGTLTIKTGKLRLNGQGADRPPELLPGEYSVVEINETGCGMPADVLARIYEPFLTTKRAGKGTGVGLSVVYGFVRQSGGYVSADSEVGKGTIFKLYFPCREAAAAQGSVDGVRHDLAPAARTELILTVDDSPTVLATAVLQLEALGYQTL